MEDLENRKPGDNIDSILKESDLIPLLEKEAEMKGLKVFVFNNEQLIEERFKPVNEVIGVALVAKNEDTARFNLRNLRRCYLIQLGK